MSDKRISRKELCDICSRNKYIMLINSIGEYSVINCKIAFLSLFGNVKKGTQKTRFIDWKECSFHEYISHKNPFQ